MSRLTLSAAGQARRDQAGNEVHEVGEVLLPAEREVVPASIAALVGGSGSRQESARRLLELAIAGRAPDCVRMQEEVFLTAVLGDLAEVLDACPPVVLAVLCGKQVVVGAQGGATAYLCHRQGAVPDRVLRSDDDGCTVAIARFDAQPRDRVVLTDGALSAAVPDGIVGTWVRQYHDPQDAATWLAMVGAEYAHTPVSVVVVRLDEPAGIGTLAKGLYQRRGLASLRG